MTVDLPRPEAAADGKREGAPACKEHRGGRRPYLDLDDVDWLIFTIGFVVGLVVALAAVFVGMWIAWS